MAEETKDPGAGEAARPTIKIMPQATKAPETGQIRLVSNDPPTGGVPPGELAKKTTGRIDQAGVEAKRTTGHVVITSPDASTVMATKKQTSRIDLSEAKGGDVPPGAPKTIRIKRPESSQMAAKPASAPLAAMPNVEASRKSETARIDLPPDAEEATPATRRKTIRIKRPEGSVSSKPLVIGSTEPTVVVSTSRGGKADEDEPGALFSVMALVAVLVACLAIYVLISQVGTVDLLEAARLPWPGQV